MGQDFVVGRHEPGGDQGDLASIRWTEIKMKTAPKKSPSFFGTCNFASTSPKVADLSPRTEVLNVVVKFEDAQKLNLAIDECIRRLNRYKRNVKEGKRRALNLQFHLQEDGWITVTEARIQKTT